MALSGPPHSGSALRASTMTYPHHSHSIVAPSCPGLLLWKSKDRAMNPRIGKCGLTKRRKWNRHIIFLYENYSGFLFSVKLVSLL